MSTKRYNPSESSSFHICLNTSLSKHLSMFSNQKSIRSKSSQFFWFDGPVQYKSRSNPRIWTNLYGSTFQNIQLIIFKFQQKSLVNTQYFARFLCGQIHSKTLTQSRETFVSYLFKYKSFKTFVHVFKPKINSIGIESNFLVRQSGTIQISIKPLGLGSFVSYYISKHSMFRFKFQQTNFIPIFWGWHS
jgi:hypothetical protein